LLYQSSSFTITNQDLFLSDCIFILEPTYFGRAQEQEAEEKKSSDDLARGEACYVYSKIIASTCPISVNQPKQTARGAEGLPG